MPTDTARLSSKRVAGFEETVFAVYTRLAKAHGAINLGQGFPDFEPPAFVLEALRTAASGYQQYAPLPGMPELLEAIAEKMQSPLARELEPSRQIQISVGATEGLFAVMQGLVDPGDEVILLEPFYDAYPADVIMAGGVPKYVPLRLQDDGHWSLDMDELRAAVSDKTKLIVLNTPHNPVGKVFSEAELDALIATAHEHDLLLVSDEVYEHIAFKPHVSPASRPGGWERSLTISSIGKTFSVTGWKIGWIVGPEALIQPVRMAHQWIPFAVAAPLQVASSIILRQAALNNYYQELSASYQRKRDVLLDALRNTALKPLEPEGSYFIMADSSALGFDDDVRLCQALPKEAGVGAIPPSAFYSAPHQHLAKHLVRFSFCKSDEAMQRAGERLQHYRA